MKQLLTRLSSASDLLFQTPWVFQAARVFWVCATFVGIFMAFQVAFWLYFDNPVAISDLKHPYAVYTRYSYQVDNPTEIHPGGGFLKFTKNVCINFPIVQGTAHRWITNGHLLEMNGIETQGTMGCGTPSRAVYIPPNLDLGAHDYHYSVEYQINPVKRMRVEVPSIHFVVTPETLPEKGDRGPRGFTGPRGPEGP